MGILRSLFYVFIYVALAAGIYAAEFMGNEYASRLVLFALWLMIVLYFLVLFVDPSELFKTKRPLLVLRLIPYLLALFMITIGWGVTGGAFLCITSCVSIKLALHDESLNNNTIAKT